MKKKSYMQTIVAIGIMTVGVIMSALNTYSVEAAEKIKISKANFPDKELRYTLHHEVDKDGDGYLSVKETNSVTRLVIDKKAAAYRIEKNQPHNLNDNQQKKMITADCKGVAYFKNVTTLEIIMDDGTVPDYYANIKNFKEIYKLKKLENLSYEGASYEKTPKFCKFKELKTLRIRKDISVEVMKFDNKKLKSIELLFCDNMAELDLRGAKNVTAVKAFDGWMQKIILAKNNKIKTLDLYCNNLKKINTKRLNPKTLQFLDIIGNPIQKIDISELKKLKKIRYYFETEVIKKKKQKVKLKEIYYGDGFYDRFMKGMYR